MAETIGRSKALKAMRLVLVLSVEAYSGVFWLEISAKRHNLASVRLRHPARMALLLGLKTGTVYFPKNTLQSASKDFPTPSSVCGKLGLTCPLCGKLETSWCRVIQALAMKR